MKKLINNQSGQALVALLIFISIAVTIIGGIAAVTVINTQNSSKFTQSENAYFIAESAVEEIILQLLRNPEYASTPVNIKIGKGNATVVVTTNNSTKTILSVGTIGNMVRKIEVKGDYIDTFKIVSWREVD